MLNDDKFAKYMSGGRNKLEKTILCCFGFVNYFGISCTSNRNGKFLFVLYLLNVCRSIVFFSGVFSNGNRGKITLISYF